mgnify:CR=1 FL=1|tara:strand:+ start:4370 stop:5719 length:1350 start_codon:yes stop_codon:yes gene_type:complete
MNIYLHVETSIKELDSKLLLGVIAASRGHQVLISDISEFERGFRRGILNPGIFHTKSITPSDIKISFHKKLIDKKFLITSNDEEAGLQLVDLKFEEFLLGRSSKKTIQQSSAIFCWGDDDLKTFKKFYPKNKSKIIKTGSPRVDLWKSTFFNYWGAPNKKPKKPYLLVSSNMGTSNGINSTSDVIKIFKDLGYLQRNSKLFNEYFELIAEDSIKTSDFVEAIKHLANENKEYDIVLRPHPIEDIEAWRLYLGNIPNVHVIREGSITAWVNNAFAVMHNGCTTALEASVIGKPVITYLPSNRKYMKNFPNKLGFRVNSLKQLSNKVNLLLKNFKLKKNNLKDKKIPKLISQKIHFDNKELASEKFIREWERLYKNNFHLPTNWKKLYLLLKITSIKNKFKTKKKNWKFPPLDKNDINEKVEKIKHVLKIKQKVDCEIISERAILIKKNNI